MNIYQKLLEVKKRVPYIKKDKKGFNYTYATPSQVFAVINPILNELGLIIITSVIGSKSQRIEIETKNALKKEWLYDLDLIFTWVDTETGEKIEIPFKASGCNGEEKGMGSALTYAERYFVLKQFNIPTDDDDPDSFQDKHMTAEEKKQRQSAILQQQQAELNAAIATATTDLNNADTLDKLRDTYKALPANIQQQLAPLVTELKTKLTPTA